ncbi:MAG: hypothetical protein K5636_03975 [Bacteroidales bacterium]|nr:hypothetical protein [Bacteroidales bacterium]
MKRLLLCLCICFMGISLFAEGDRPIVIVHKSNGGYWAWLNLYNDILYHPSEDGVEPATLDCTGAGFSACRVPRVNPFLTPGDNASSPTLQRIMPAITDAINEIIEKSEERSRSGNNNGSYTKKIATPSNGHSGYETFFIQGKWAYNTYGEGTLKIYINQSSILGRI